MAVPPEVQAAIIKVSGDWASHLANVEPKHRKAALARLLRRYRAICAILQEVHGTQFKT